MNESQAAKAALLGPLALLAASAIWGGTYSVMKNALVETPPFLLIAIEYGLATLVLLPIAGPRLLRTPRSVLKPAAGMGLLWFGGVACVFTGLQGTSPGLSAFIVVQIAVVTPVLVGLTGGGWFDRRLGAAIALVVIGMAVIFLLGEETAFSAMTALTAVAVLFLAFHMIVLSRLTHLAGAATLVLVQTAITSGCAAVGYLLFETHSDVGWSPGAWTLVAVLYGGIGSSLLAVVLQAVGQRWTPVTHVGIFLSLESVFATVISVALGLEALHSRTAAGFLLVFAGTVLAQTGLRRRQTGGVVEEPLEMAAPL